MNRLGFTLSEVLVTLVIIGVVAAITVPTLYQNSNSQEYRSTLKKAISAANQAIIIHHALNGTGTQDYSTAEDLVNNLFKKRMNVLNLGTYSEEYKIGECETRANAFSTQDGITYCITNWAIGDNLENQTIACNSFNTKPCTENESQPNLWIDVNGERKPNKVTTNSTHPRDVYQAQIYNKTVVPFGIPTQEIMFEKEVSTGA